MRSEYIFTVRYSYSNRVYAYYNPKPQVGLDDRQHGWFRELKLEAARALVKEGSPSLCRRCARARPNPTTLKL